jgi:2-(1,2-epoxy-1,2-dihydrophenyl)acetyl-CoA isomerase
MTHGTPQDRDTVMGAIRVASTGPSGDEEPVLVELRGAIAWVTLNRPDTLNAMNAELMDHLRDALLKLAHDRTVRCVVLRGAGTSFCAGGDVHMMVERRDDADTAPSVGSLMEDMHRDLLRRSEASLLLAEMAKPTFAVLHGHVVGGGMCLALACDFRTAAESTRLRMGFVRNGLSGDFGISFLLSRAVGSVQARELLMLDPVLTAREALDRRLVTSICADHDLDTASSEFAERLAAGPTIAFGRIKDNLRLSATMTMAQAIEIEASNQRVPAMTADASEAGHAFVERRPPRFAGR